MLVDTAEPNSEEHGAASEMNQLTIRVLLFFGERLAFILFFIFAVTLFLSGNLVPQAFSQKEDPRFTKQDANWYSQNISFSVPKSDTDNLSVQVSAVVVTPTPTPTSQPISATDDDPWLKLAECESHQNWTEDTGNGYFGGLQFNQSAWESTGGAGNPAQASKDEQIMRGKILQERRGWGPWGSCSKKLGLQ